MNRENEQLIMADAAKAVNEVEAKARTATGPDAQGAMMDAYTAQVIWDAMNGIYGQDCDAEGGLAVMGWTLTLLARGTLGDLIAQTA